MQRNLMERHLEHLHAELVARLPERAGRYDLLRLLVAHLRDVRVATLPAATFASISGAFDERTRHCKGAVKNMGTVIVAAVADAAAGIGTVLGKVSEWAQDPAHFDREWIQAVQAIIEQARAALTTPAGSA